LLTGGMSLARPPEWLAREGGRFMAATIIPILIEIICGAGGGMAIGRWARSLDLGAAGNAVTGAIGGLILTWLTARIPGIGRFVGHVEQVADSAARGMGGLTPSVLVGVGIAGLLGGILLTAVVGLARRRSAAKNI
jgi:hypothetical protein